MLLYNTSYLKSVFVIQKPFVLILRAKNITCKVDALIFFFKTVNCKNLLLLMQSMYYRKSPIIQLDETSGINIRSIINQFKCYLGTNSSFSHWQSLKSYWLFFYIFSGIMLWCMSSLLNLFHFCAKTLDVVNQMSWNINILLLAAKRRLLFKMASLGPSILQKGVNRCLIKIDVERLFLIQFWRHFFLICFWYKVLCYEYSTDLK